MEELEAIVQRMIDAGEPESNIAAVIQEYNNTQQAGKIQPQVTGAPVEETAALEDMDSKPEIGLLESLGARTARGFTSFFKGQASLANSLIFSAVDLFSKDMSTEDKVALKEALDVGLPGSMIPSTFQLENIENVLSQSVRETKNQSITEALTNGNFAEAAELTVGGALESAPSLLAAFAGPGGIVAMGTSSAGNKFSEEFDLNPEEATSKLALNAAATGAIEAGFEFATRGLLKSLKLVPGQEVTTKQAAGVLSKNLTKSLFNKIGGAYAKEGASESATELTLVLNDYLTLGKETNIQDAATRAIDAFAIGGFVGGSLGTVSAIGGNGTAARERAEYILAPTKTKTYLKKVSNDLNSLYAELKTEETEDGKNIILNEIKKIETEVADIKKENSINLSFLEGTRLKQYAKNAEEINKATRIITSNKSSQAAKDLAKESIENFVTANNNLIQNAKEEKFQRTLETAKKTAEQQGIDFKTFENKQDLEQYELSRDKRKTKQSKKIAETADGYIMQFQDGRQEIVINKEVALEKGAVNVAAHELLHGLLFNTVKNNAEGTVNLGKALGSALSQIDINQVTDSKLIQRLQSYSNKPESIQAEELIALTSDAIATGDLQFNETIFTKIGDGVRRLLQDLGFKKIKFDTAQDVYNFVKDYNKDISKGGVRKVMLEAAEKGFTGKLLSGKVSEEQQQIIKQSISENKKADIMQKYNEGMQNIERTEYKGNNPLPGRLEGELVMEFMPYINKLISSKFRQLEEEAITRDDAEAILFEEALKAIRTFNPAKNDDISGYVARLLALRQSKIFQDVKTEFTEGVEAAEKITEEINENITTEQANIPKEKIRLSEGIDTTIEVEGKQYKEHVTKSLEKAVALSIKNINADISANRTVTPFVNSIKENVADDLRKITKSFINQYGYESFLKDHKPLLLNNFTTTYLSKHPLFRKGIEKSIGGTMETDNQGNKIFKPNWTLPKEISKGKFEWVDQNGKKAKIDRDNAGARGLTSGPEFIRRSSKINSIITDNEFIDYHFQDGALRKKKKQNPEDALARQLSAELAFEYLQHDFLNEKVLFEKAKEYGDALEIVISDAAAEQLAKEIDRGTVKFSNSVVKVKPEAFQKATDVYVNEGAEAFENYINKTYTGRMQPIGKYLTDWINDGLWKPYLLQLRKEADKGIAYEKSIGDLLKGAKFENIDIILEGAYQGNKGDLFLINKNVDGLKVGIEIKLNDKAQLGSFTIKNLNGTEVTLNNIPSDVAQKIKDALVDYTDKVNKYLNAAEKYAKENNLPFERKGDFMQASPKVLNALKDGFDGVKQSDLNISIPLENISIIQAIYDNKDSQYMQIGGAGLYYIGKNASDNILNAPLLSRAEAGLQLNIRPTKTTNGELRGFALRAFPAFSGKIIKSEMTLDNPKTVKATLQGFNAKFSISETDKNRMNDMISETGKVSVEEISEVTATRLGRTKGRFKFFIPPSADDFMGLMYYTLRKGDLGNQDLKFIKEKLIDPFTRGQAAFDTYKLSTLNQFRGFKKLIRKVPKAKLSSKNDLGFTNEEAVRVYIWNKQGETIPGISENEISSLVKLVEGNADLLSFAGNISNLLAAQGGYPSPQENWFGGSITIDVLEHINEISRKEFFAEFIEASENLFGKLNNRGEIQGPIANKLRAAYGDNYIESISDILYRMKNGRGREFGKNKLVNEFNNWISNSVGAVMFLNARSALLQQVSLVNFINLTDNNPIKFAGAIANTKQYWTDYLALLNSDYLVQRRSGIKIDVNQDELVKAAESGRNPVQSVISLILKKGFVLTTWGDSHAIATGGATFYRNRINTYLNDGLSQAEAEEKAFNDFKELAEESQQSSRPDRISKQQASTLGRLILAWANTPMQYARITKKAALDLINGRGDWKTNTSKLIYYGAIQNLMFTYLQQGLFAMIFDGEDKEEEDMDKYGFAFNSMADGFLRGLGFGGAIASTSKNMVLEAIEQAKGRGNYDEVVWEALKLSPPLGSKISKARAVGRTFGWKQEREKVFTEGFSLDNPAFEAVGKAVSATTNIPLDRVVRKLDNITYPMRHDTEFWQTIALYLGWGQWELGLKDVKKREKEKPDFKTMSKEEYKKYMQNK
jgi:hypothetical protein